MRESRRDSRRGRGEEREGRKGRDRDRGGKREANESLRRHTEEMYNRPDVTFATIINTDMDVPEYYCKSSDEEHVLDVIPYTATKKHPQCAPNGKVKAGDLVVCAEYHVHKRVGPSNAMFVCPTKTFPNSNLRCPVCEKRAGLAEDLGWDHKKVAAMKPIHFGVYNVKVYDDEKEKAKGIQVWPVQWHYFGKPLKARSKNPRTGGFVYYADPDVGKTISFYKKGKENVVFDGHQFLDRDYVIDEDTLEEAYVIEDLVPILSYDEIKELMGSDEDDPDEKEDRRGGKDKDRGGSKDKKDKAPKYTVEEIMEMSKKELKAVIEDEDLDVNPKKYDDADELAEAVVEALGLEDDKDKGKDDGPTADDIRDMSKKELKALIKDEDLDVDPKDYDDEEELAEAIIEEMGLEDKKKSGKSKKDDGPTADDIRDMSKKEMKALIKDEDLDVDPKDYDDEDELADAIIEEMGLEKKKNKAGKKEEKEEKKGRGKKGDGDCPEDMEFGVDIDSKECCGDCKNYDDCADEYDKLQKKNKSGRR